MLILCEKPSVAKEFAKALNAAFKDGCYQNGNTAITNCIGHLFSLVEPDGYNPAYKKWALSDLPIIPEHWRYEQNEGTKEQAAAVLSLFKKHQNDEILIATDAGREGELIAREVLLHAGITDISKCRRFWVSEALTEQVIKNGIQNAKPLADYDKTAAQAFARERADWLVGMNLSRYLSINNAAFSVGRVQTALLNAIAVRNEASANFVPQPYQELSAAIRSANGAEITALLVNPQNGETAFPGNGLYVLEARDYCGEKAVDYASAVSSRKTQKPEKLLNITGLQKAAYKSFGYSPEKTLETAQALYEKHRCLSYPRTPSRVMGDNNADLFLEKFNVLKNDFPEFSKYSDISLINQPNKHIFNSAQLEDHHALIPLNHLPAGAAEHEKNVYGLVIKSFFTVCMPDYICNEKRLSFNCGQYAFSATLRETVQAGWKASAEKDDKEEIQETEAFDEKNCRIVKTEILNKKTTPPKEYSIDTLLSFMENPRDEDGAKLAGLGTPATRAAIIKKLFMQQYITEEKKKLYATEKGKYLLSQLKKDKDLAKIADVSQTTEWEKQLAEDPAAFESSIVAYIRACIKQDVKRETYQETSIGKCPLCGRGIRDGQKSFYCPGYKDNACNFSIWKEITGAKVSPADARALLAGKKTGVKKCVSKAGKNFNARFYLDADKKTAFEFV